MDLPPPTTRPFVDLPDVLDIGTDPEDDWTQIVYDQHQIAAHEEPYGETHLWLHLLEGADGRLQMDPFTFLDGLQSLQKIGFRVVDQRPVPISGGQTIRIVTMEGLDLDDEAIEEGVESAYLLSREAIRER